MSLLTSLPWAFWLVVFVLLGLVAEACRRIRRPWAIPALLTYGTIGAWYLGDLLQAGATDFLGTFGTNLTNLALMQVALCLGAYRLFVQKLLPQQDDAQASVSVARKIAPLSMTRFFHLVFIAWLVIFVIGVAVSGWDILAIVWPPSSPDGKVSMFARKGVGSGADFLLSTAGYIYVLFCALFGMMFVLARGTTRLLSALMVLFTWPYFLFDRARSGMLALILPPVFCYLIATWGHWKTKAVVVSAAFLLVYLWFGQVMHYRDADAGAYKMSAMLDFSHDKTEQQLGLDMLKELCYMDYFVDTGAYQPNWGTRYFAEVVNVVPRTIWPGKPLAGYDYAYARGFRDESADEEAVFATISTGMIGQGIANFGRFFGVLTTALLMALWTLILAKLWRRRYELPRFLLFLVGCGLTFNMGRDITLLVLWPFVFGYALVVLLERLQPRAPAARRGPRIQQPARPLTPPVMAVQESP